MLIILYVMQIFEINKFILINNKKYTITKTANCDINNVIVTIVVDRLIWGRIDNN